MPGAFRFFSLTALCAVAACSSSTGGDPVNLVAVFEGNTQTAETGAAVAIDPAVKVTVDGVAVAGETVQFAVSQGGGTLTGAAAVSGADGVARVGSWVMGPAGPQAITATLAGATGSPVTITATSTALVASAIEAVDDPTTGTVGVATTPAPRVRIESASGSPVAGAAVTWTVTGGGGAITGADVVTGSDGTASVDSWTLGTLLAGNPNTLTATAVCCGTITFTAAAAAGPVTTITKVEGDLQTRTISTAVLILPKVLLTDVFGNPTPNRAITFTAAIGGGLVTGSPANSAADGTASVGSWTLGAAAGANRLDATSNGVTVSFTATGTLAGLAGNYAGTWTNTTFGSTGAGTAVITLNSITNAATVTATATGNVLGGGPASPPTQNGTFVPGGTTNFVGTVPPMGNIVASMNASGQITASATGIPGGGGITGWTATGTITEAAIALTFTVTFNVGAPAVGTINLTRQP